MTSKHFRCIEHTIPAQHIRHYAQATAHTQEEELQLSVKQYIPLHELNSCQTGITLIAAHANGLCKELYQPLWDDLLELCRAHNLPIRSIWFADAVHQGASGVLNADKLGNEPSTFDHGRDLLHMVNHFRRQIIMPVFGFAHSLGGVSMIQLSLLHPRLFQGLILIDPIVRARPSIDGLTMQTAYLSTLRKDRWPSRESAAKQLRSTAFYKSWDPRVLELFIQHSLRTVEKEGNTAGRADDGMNPVVLTTTKAQEAFSAARPAYPPDHNAPLRSFVPSRLTHPDLVGTNATGHIYAEPVPFYRPEGNFIFAQLPQVRPRVLILSPASSNVTSTLERAEVLSAIGRGPGGSGGVDENAVREIVIDKTDHFFPFSQPALAAENMMIWLKESFDNWEAHEATAWKYWASKPDEEKRSLNNDWKFWMNKHFGARKAGLRSKL